MSITENYSVTYFDLLWADLYFLFLKMCCEVNLRHPLNRFACFQLKLQSDLIGIDIGLYAFLHVSWNSLKKKDTIFIKICVREICRCNPLRPGGRSEICRIYSELLPFWCHKIYPDHAFTLVLLTVKIITSYL